MPSTVSTSVWSERLNRWSLTTPPSLRHDDERGDAAQRISSDDALGEPDPAHQHGDQRK